MKTYLGAEVKFCSYCRRELVLTMGIGKTSWWAECPEKIGFFGIFADNRHSKFYLGDITPNFDSATGERVRGKVNEL